MDECTFVIFSSTDDAAYVASESRKSIITTLSNASLASFSTENKVRMWDLYFSPDVIWYEINGLGIRGKYFNIKDTSGSKFLRNVISSEGYRAKRDERIRISLFRSFFPQLNLDIYPIF